MTKEKMITVLSTGGVMLAIGISVVAIAADTNHHDTCWTEPDPHRYLDFDFVSFQNGQPVRCGYLQPKSALPQVLGDEARAAYSDLLCYPLKKIDCKR